MQQHNFHLGQRGEDRAAHFLTSHGYVVLDRNCRLGSAEVDLVVWDPAMRELVFVEVKTRRTQQFGWASGAVDGRKVAHILRVARAYRQQHHRHGAYRVDIVCVVDGTIEHFQNVTWSG